MQTEEKLESSPVSGSENRPGGWATLAFVIVILAAADFSSGIWRSLPASFDCEGLWPRNWNFKVNFFEIHHLGMLLGGLLTWRCGFRLSLGAFLVWQGLILIGSQIVDLEQVGCLMQALFGFGFGFLFPACFSALAGSLRTEQWALPLLILVFILPSIANPWVGFGWVRWVGLGWVFKSASTGSIAYVLTGAGLLALAWLARRKNSQWLDLGSAGKWPGPAGPGLIAWLRTLKIDAAAGRLILAGLCALTSSVTFMLFLFSFYVGGGDIQSYSDDYAPMIDNMFRGGLLVIPVAIYVHLKGPGRAWPLIVGAFLGQGQGGRPGFEIRPGRLSRRS